LRSTGGSGSSKTRKRKADDEVIEIPVPAIVELDTFEQVRRQLHARSPKRQPPRFGRTIRENFSTGSVPFRKAYLRSLIDVIEVDDHQIRIKGNKELLEKAVLASQNAQPWCSQASTRWRARREALATQGSLGFSCGFGPAYRVLDTTSLSQSSIGAERLPIRKIITGEPVSL
jgi:hypothetical protein